MPLNYKLIITYTCREIHKELQKEKKADVTATTGMARLQFVNGMTIHHWSGYGDGNKNVHQLVEQILTNPSCAATKHRIVECDCLIIDEIGLLSSKAFDNIEFICRNVHKTDRIFGGVQVIAAGSFVQLPPVPSLFDPGKYAFESDMFTKVFPHKIHLDTVMHQDQQDLINAINELCLG